MNPAQHSERSTYAWWAMQALDKARRYRNAANEAARAGSSARAGLLRACAYRYLAFAKEYRSMAGPVFRTRRIASSE